jgi:hypothetical protein
MTAPKARHSGALRSGEPGIHVWTAPGLQGLAARMGLVDCGHVSGLCVRSDRPLAQMRFADQVPEHERDV